MPTIPPGTVVQLDQNSHALLRYPPPIGGMIVVAVEVAALRSPQSSLTTVVSFRDNTIDWVGSVDERMLNSDGAGRTDARQLLSDLLLHGDRLWQIIQPGFLRTQLVQDTVYQGKRPWIVLGNALDVGLLAAPLNDIGEGIRGHYQCELLSSVLPFPGSIDSKLELNHLWSFPSTTPPSGMLASQAHCATAAAIRGYYPRRT
jgi:hypothetical protein